MESAGDESFPQHLALLQAADGGIRRIAHLRKHVFHAVSPSSHIGCAAALCLVAAIDGIGEAHLPSSRQVGSTDARSRGPLVVDHRRHGLLGVFSEIARSFLCCNHRLHCGGVSAVVLPQPAQPFFLAHDIPCYSRAGRLSAIGHLWFGCRIVDGSLVMAVVSNGRREESLFLHGRHQ